MHLATTPPAPVALELQHPRPRRDGCRRHRADPRTPRGGAASSAQGGCGAARARALLAALRAEGAANDVDGGARG